MDFHTVEFEDDLDELDESDLRELVTEYQEAQQANLEAVEEVADEIDEFQSFKEDVTERAVELSELPEDDVRSLSFSGRRKLISRLEDDEADDDSDFEEEGGDDDGTDFDDMGNRGETHGEDGTPEVVEQAFSNMTGVVLDS